MDAQCPPDSNPDDHITSYHLHGVCLLICKADTWGHPNCRGLNARWLGKLLSVDDSSAGISAPADRLLCSCALLVYRPSMYFSVCFLSCPLEPLSWLQVVASPGRSFRLYSPAVPSLRPFVPPLALIHFCPHNGCTLQAPPHPPLSQVSKWPS